MGQTSRGDRGGATDPVDDWIQLSADERIAWRGRPSARTLAPGLLPGAAVVVLGLAAAVGLGAVGASFPWWAWLLPAAFVVAGASAAALVVLRWRATHYVITSTEVYKKRGVVSEYVTQLRLDRVQNVAYSQTGLQRALGYGDVSIHTAGSGSETPELVLERVPDPAGVNRTLSAQLDAATGSTAGV